MGLNLSQNDKDWILNLINDLDYDFDDFTLNEWEIDDFEDRFPAAYQVRTGASKRVIIPPDKDFVIKIPFRYNEDIRYNPDCSRYGDSYTTWNSAAGTWVRAVEPDYGLGDEVFCSAYYIIDGTNGWDYCKAEVQMYQYVQENYPTAIEMLAETVYVGTVAGTPVYAQERCITYSESEVLHYSDEARSSYETKIRSTMSERDRVNGYGKLFPKDFEICCVDDYSLETLLEFFNFINYEHVGDFHWGNIGLFADKMTPCVFDYSGYWD